ncbi:SAF domain protein [mine drainage metagenome]|uniref:SAF domain protein n=1 Tax=mine drainage metagenome TaxID=410659 RepID=A0A1J5RA23_9ZZZZ
MKSPRAIAMLVASAILGLVAATMAVTWLQQRAVAADKVVVAAVDIQLGSRLDAQMLRVANWPAGSVPSGAVSDPGELQGRVLRSSLIAGEPVLMSKLAPVGAQGGLSAVIAPGHRAITVRVNDVIGVAGFALPGNYVDILVSTEAGQGETASRQISKIVLQHILVLAVAQQAARDETKPRVVNAVTLEVTPEQAEMLDLARSIGTLSLVLRNQMDRTQVALPGVMRPQLLATGAQAEEVPVAASPAATAPKPRARLVAPRHRAPAAARGACVDVIKNGISTRECF